MKATYILNIYLHLEKLSGETDQEFKERSINEARNKAVQWISGNLFDPQKKIFSENLKIVEH